MMERESRGDPKLSKYELMFGKRDFEWTKRITIFGWHCSFDNTCNIPTSKDLSLLLLDIKDTWKEIYHTIVV